MDDLEYEFNQLMRTPFETLRNNYYYRKHSKEETEALQKMLEERLGTKDPEGEVPEEAWRKSNWCSDG